MSAAASKLRLESPSIEDAVLTEDVLDAHEFEALERLTAISPPSSAGPIIAIDLDDVLCLTNQAVAECRV